MQQEGVGNYRTGAYPYFTFIKIALQKVCMIAVSYNVYSEYVTYNCVRDCREFEFRKILCHLI